MNKIDAELERQLSVLRGGGPEATNLFLKTSRQAFETDDPQRLDDWVLVALEVMDELMIHSLLCNLLRASFGNPERKIDIAAPNLS